MQAPALGKFGFRIRTRAGLIVDNLRIPGRDQVEAERKVRQLYRDCAILYRYNARPPEPEFQATMLLGLQQEIG